MMRFGRIHPLRLVPVLLAITAAGCSTKYTVPVSDLGLPQYTRLLVAYDQAPRDIIVADHAIHADAAPARVAQNIQASAIVSHLQIEFPHPAGRAGYGLATLTRAHPRPEITRSVWWHGRGRTTPETLAESARPTSATHARPTNSAQSNIAQSNIGGNSGTTVSQASTDGSEIWLLDISRARLDQLLIACANSGFFEQTDQSTGAAHIAFQIDNGRAAKNWSSHPALDDIVSEVSRRGHFAGPHTPLPASPAR